jgi:hypothetical protein
VLLRASLLVAVLSPCALGQQDQGTAAGGMLPNDAVGEDLPDTGRAGDGSWETRLGLYIRPDSGGTNGNPFLEEELIVIEPVVIYEKFLTDDDQLHVTFSYDKVSSASIDRLSKYPVQSGASGDNYIGIDLGMNHWTSKYTNWGWHIGASNEYDYSSVGGGFSWHHDLDPADASVSLSLDFYSDSLDLIQFNGVETGTDDRTSITANASWYQILTPNDVGEFGVTLADQDGFLGTPYNGVVIEDGGTPPFPFANGSLGTEFAENVPRARQRTAVWGRWRHLLSPGRSFELGMRAYDDDWGISAFTLEPRWYAWFEDQSLLRLRYRFYTQGEADFFSDQFLAVAPLQTQDSGLGGFDTHMIGAQYFWFTGEATRWDVGLDYVSSSDGLDSILATFGWKWSF